MNPKSAFTKWIDEKLPLPRLVYNAVGAGYPVPRNLNYMWNFRRARRIFFPGGADCHRCRASRCIIAAQCQRRRFRLPTTPGRYLLVRNVNYGWMFCVCSRGDERALASGSVLSRDLAALSSYPGVLPFRHLQGSRALD